MRPLFTIVVSLTFLIVVSCHKENDISDAYWDTATHDENWTSFKFLPEKELSPDEVSCLYGEPSMVGRFTTQDFMTNGLDSMKGIYHTVVEKYDTDRLLRYDWNKPDKSVLVLFYDMSSRHPKAVGGFCFNPLKYHLSDSDFRKHFYVPAHRYWNPPKGEAWDLVTKNQFWTSFKYLKERKLSVDSIDKLYGSHRSFIESEDSAPLYYSDQRLEGTYRNTYGKYKAEDITVRYWKVDSCMWLILFYYKDGETNPLGGFLYNPATLPE